MPNDKDRKAALLRMEYANEDKSRKELKKLQVPRTSVREEKALKNATQRRRFPGSKDN